MYWLARTYARDPDDAPHPSLVVRPGCDPAAAHRRAAAGLARGAARKQEENASARRRARTGARRQRRRCRPSSSELRAEIAVAKAANERASRRPRLLRGRDPRPLHRPAAARGRLAARPGARPRVRGRRHAEQGRQGLRRLRALGRRRPAARAWSRPSAPRESPQVGQQQAKLYADCLEQQFGQRPVIFYTNGYEHWIWDDTAATRRARSQGFYTKDELELLIQRRTTRAAARRRATINTAIVERHYQHRAIRRDRRGLRARQAAQGAAGDGDRRRQDPHRRSRWSTC